MNINVKHVVVAQLIQQQCVSHVPTVTKRISMIVQRVNVNVYEIYHYATHHVPTATKLTITVALLANANVLLSYV